MAENDLTTKAPVLRDLPGKSYLVDLEDLLDKSTDGLRAFYDLINSDNYNELLIIFEQLLDRQQADLKKVAQAINTSIGAVQIEVAYEYFRRDGQSHNKGDLIQASIEWPKETTSVEIRKKTAGQKFFTLPGKWIDREKATWQELVAKVKKIETQPEIDPQALIGLASTLEAFGAHFWGALEKQAASIDDFLPGEPPADPLVINGRKI